jgi:hypothetical protein
LSESRLARIADFQSGDIFRECFQRYFHETSLQYRERMLNCHFRMESWRPAAATPPVAFTA